MTGGASLAVRALAVLADMRTPEAFNVALRVLDSAMDENLDFLLELIGREQADVWMPAFAKGTIKLNGNPKHMVFAMKSTGRRSLPAVEMVNSRPRLSTTR